tara:strand:+ start:367 stop:744 length:378 start_codon:yes stop_codon:yes gene_type:complete
VEEVEETDKMRNKVLPGLARHMKPITIEHATLEPGITAEAVSESKIVVNKDVPKDSDLYKRAIAHETHHAKEMASGRIAYGDDFVRDGDQVFARQDGKIQQGSVWKMEGSKDFPWERRAHKAEES